MLFIKIVLCIVLAHFLYNIYILCKKVNNGLEAEAQKGLDMMKEIRRKWVIDFQKDEKLFNNLVDAYGWLMAAGETIIAILIVIALAIL